MKILLVVVNVAAVFHKTEGHFLNLVYLEI